jgi:uncharacterized membrane protein HdeD (DUF308 family)
MTSPLTRNWWVLALRGVAAIIFGVLAFLFPLAAIKVLVIFYGAFALVSGIFALGAALAGVHPGIPTWALIVQGLAGIVIGLIVFFMPEEAVTAIILLIGAWEVVNGVTTIVAAIRLRKEIEGELLLGISGLLSVIVGVIIMARPLVGEILVAYLIGFYALFFGITMLALAFRLRNWHRDMTAAGRP